MTLGKATSILGAALGTAVIFYTAGRLAGGGPDWSRQHINKSNDSKEFRNELHGLTVRAPDGPDWDLVYDPAMLGAVPADVNKVLELNCVPRGRGYRGRWARMDLFVEPLRGGTSINDVIEKLEFRDKRPAFKVLERKPVGIGGAQGEMRLGVWTVKRRKFRSANYSVEHKGKLYAFIGVTEARSFQHFRPVFDRIVATVRLD